MSLEKITILTPPLLKKYVFAENNGLKLLRRKGVKDIIVANEDMQHKWMGVPSSLVASAASISKTGKDSPALTYVLGGKSLDNRPKFIFLETEDERKITLDLLEEMLLVIKRTGIEVYDPNAR